MTEENRKCPFCNNGTREWSAGGGRIGYNITTCSYCKGTGILDEISAEYFWNNQNLVGPEVSVGKMPKQKPGKSEQTVSTPADFMSAVESRFGKMDFDLAALPSNTKADNYFTPGQDSLKQDWNSITGNNFWLNPPYADIEPWVKKAKETTWGKGRSHKNIFVLIPASVGTNYYAKYIHDNAQVLFLRPRITFDTHSAPYPKDLMLCIYGDIWRFSSLLDCYGNPGFHHCWNWKTDEII